MKSWPDPPFTDIPQCRGISDFADNLLVKALGPPPDTVLESSITIPTTSSYSSTALVTKPSDIAQPGPLVVLFHPGGFFLGSPSKLTIYARPLTQLFNASVLCPSYRFAPKHPFPTGIEDVWATLKWATSHASELDADSNKGFLVGGISSGANFAVALPRRAVEEKLESRLTGVWAPIFMGLHEEAAVPATYKDLWVSHDQHRDAPVTNHAKAATMWQYYRPCSDSPLFNPLALPLDTIGDMPKTFLQVAGHDLFRDEGSSLRMRCRMREYL